MTQLTDKMEGLKARAIYGQGSRLTYGFEVAHNNK